MRKEKHKGRQKRIEKKKREQEIDRSENKLKKKSTRKAETKCI